MEGIGGILAGIATLWGYWENRKKRLARERAEAAEERAKASERRERRTSIELEAIRKGWTPAELARELRIRGLD